MTGQVHLMVKDPMHTIDRFNGSDRSDLGPNMANMANQNNNQPLNPNTGNDPHARGCIKTVNSKDANNKETIIFLLCFPYYYNRIHLWIDKMENLI